MVGQVHPGRGIGAPADLPKRIPSRGKLLRDVVKASLPFADQVRGLPAETPELAAAAERAFARLDAPDTKAPLELDVEAVTFNVLSRQAIGFHTRQTQIAKLVRLWFWAEGPAFAVEALLRGTRCGVFNESGGQIRIGRAESSQLRWYTPTSRRIEFKRDGPAEAMAFLELRALLSTADEDGYRAARDRAAALRADCAPLNRVWLGWLFPTEAGWALEDAEAALATDEPPSWARLPIPALADPALALRLLAATPRLRGAGPADVLAQHGGAAGPALIEVCRTARTERDYSTYFVTLDVLSHVLTPDVAAYLAELQADADKHDQSRIDAFYRHAPELSLAALRAAPSEAGAAKIEEILRANPALDANAGPIASAVALPSSLQAAATGPALDPKDWDPAWRPELRLVGGGQLPPEALARLGQLLRDSEGRREPALMEALGALEPADRIALADALWERWSEGANKWQVWLAARKWLGLAQGPLGDDAVARRIGREVRGWSGQRFNQGKACLFALQTIGSDAALLQIQDIARRGRSNGIQRAAEQTLHEIAQARGVTVEALRDALIPTLDLEDADAWRFDYGPRAFELVLERDLTPKIREPGGGIRSGLPKKAAGDDAAKAKAAGARWRALKASLKEAAPGLLARWERAMIEGTRRPAGIWSTSVAGHPLQAAIARGLVWGCWDGGALKATFTLADDGRCLDAGGAEITLVGAVGPVHPAELDAATLGAWRAAVTGPQPIRQLARPVFAPGAPDTAAAVAAWSGQVSPRRIRGLIGSGWSRGPVEDNGFFKSASGAGGAARVELSFPEGLNVSSAAADPPTTAVTAALSGGQAGPAFSELILALTR